MQSTLYQNPTLTTFTEYEEKIMLEAEILQVSVMEPNTSISFQPIRLWLLLLYHLHLILSVAIPTTQRVRKNCAYCEMDGHI